MTQSNVCFFSNLSFCYALVCETAKLKKKKTWKNLKKFSCLIKYRPILKCIFKYLLKAKISLRSLSNIFLCVLHLCAALYYSSQRSLRNLFCFFLCLSSLVRNGILLATLVASAMQLVAISWGWASRTEKPKVFDTAWKQFNVVYFIWYSSNITLHAQ